MSGLADRILSAYESFNRGEVDAILDLLHPDVEWVPPPTSVEPEPLHGRDAVREYLEPDFFESQNAEPLETIEKGNHLLVVVRVRARGRGSGLELDETVHHLLTIAHGQAVRFEVYIDRAAALAAMERA
jgi:ketosteroid isomerase-like protein